MTVEAKEKTKKHKPLNMGANTHIKDLAPFTGKKEKLPKITKLQIKMCDTSKT
jgi:hypothetical protein